MKLKYCFCGSSGLFLTLRDLCWPGTTVSHMVSVSCTVTAWYYDKSTALGYGPMSAVEPRSLLYVVLVALVPRMTNKL